MATDLFVREDPASRVITIAADNVIGGVDACRLHFEDRGEGTPVVNDFTVELIVVAALRRQS